MHSHGHYHHQGHCAGHRDRTPLGVSISVDDTTAMLIADSHKNFDVTLGATVVRVHLNLNGARDGRAGKIVIRAGADCEVLWGTDAASIAPLSASVAAESVNLFEYYASDGTCFISRLQ